MSTHLWPEPLLPLMCDDPANDSRAQSQEHQNASYHSAHQQHGNVSENLGVATSEQKIKIHKSICFSMVIFSQFSKTFKIFGKNYVKLVEFGNIC